MIGIFRKKFKPLEPIQYRRVLCAKIDEGKIKTTIDEAMKVYNKENVICIACRECEIK